jgi:hypothetical protein
MGKVSISYNNYQHPPLQKTKSQYFTPVLKSTVPSPTIDNHQSYVALIHKVTKLPTSPITPLVWNVRKQQNPQNPVNPVQKVPLAS